MMQHIRGMPGLWGGNCDQTPIITASDPSNLDPREMERSLCYTTGYMCKNKDTIGGTLDVMTAVVRAQDEEGDDLPINKTILQCMNKTVGRQEVSDPAAASFLACLPLWQCSRSFQPVSLGSYRGITPWNYTSLNEANQVGIQFLWMVVQTGGVLLPKILLPNTRML